MKNPTPTSGTQRPQSVKRRLVLDAGALIAVERGDRAVMGMLEVAYRDECSLITHAGIVGQMWRSSSKQARLSRFLKTVKVISLDQSLARDAGLLLAATGLSDVLDASLVGIVREGDRILTSDLDDIGQLVAARKMRDLALVAI